MERKMPMDWVRDGCDIKENEKSWTLTCKTCGKKWRARIMERSPDGALLVLEPAIVLDRVLPHVQAHAHGRSLEVH